MGSGYCARDTSEDSRHSVQVVDAAGVMGLGVLGEEWLRKENRSLWFVINVSSY